MIMNAHDLDNILPILSILQEWNHHFSHFNHRTNFNGHPNQLNCTCYQRNDARYLLCRFERYTPCHSKRLKTAQNNIQGCSKAVMCETG